MPDEKNPPTTCEPRAPTLPEMGNNHVRTSADLVRFLDELDERMEDISTCYKAALFSAYAGSSEVEFTSLEERLLAITTDRNLLEFVKHWIPLTRDRKTLRRLVLWRGELEKTQVEFDHTILHAYQACQSHLRDYTCAEGEQNLSLVELSRRLQSEESPDARDRTQGALVEFTRRYGGDFEALALRRNRSAINFGYTDYPSLHLNQLEIDGASARKGLDELLELTESVYRRWIEDVSKRIGRMPRPADLQFAIVNSYNPAWNDLFSSQSIQTLMVDRLGEAGLDMDRLPLATQPAEIPSTAIPVGIPNDIRLLVGPSGGLQALVRLAREYGKALYFAHVDASCYTLRSVPEVLLEIGAALAADVLLAPPALGSLVRDESVVQNVARYMELSDVFHARVFAAVSGFELRWYAETEHADETWRNEVNSALCVEADADWASQSLLVAKPFHALPTALAYRNLPAMKRRLAQVPEKKQMEFLIERLFVHGSEVPWPDIIRDFLAE